MTTPVQPQPQPIQGQPATPPIDPRPMTGAELNRRVQHGDQNFPPELWGRTLGEAMRYYAVMRQDFINRQQASQGQPQLQGQPQAGQPQQPQPQRWPTSQPQPQQQQPMQVFPNQQPPTGYIPPQGQPQGEVPLTLDAVRQVVADTISRSLGPMAQASAASVQEQMRRKFVDWAHYEQAILAELQGAEPTALLNPGLWESAYYYVKGRVLSENPPRPQAFDPNQPPQPQQVPGGPIVRPVPAAFFSEAPTPPSNQPGPNGQVNDPMDDLYARRFGMTTEEYRMWKGGNVPVPQRQPAQQPQGQFNPSGNGGGWR